MARTFFKILISLAILWPFPAIGLTLKANQETTWLGKHLQLLRDSSHELTLEDLLDGSYDSEFFTQDRDIPTFGYIDRNSYWAKIDLENPTNKVLTFYIVSRYAPIDFLSIFSPQPDGSYAETTLGDQLAFNKRPIAYRFPVFPIKVAPGTSTFYFWTRTTSSTQFPLTISSPRSFEEHDTSESIYLGLLCGACLVMMCYNFFIFFKFRSRSFLYYVLYTLAYTSFAMNYHGLVQQFLLPKAENSWITNAGMMISIELSCVMAYTFTIEFLRLDVLHPRLCLLIKIIRIECLFNIANWLTFQTGCIPITILNSFLLSLILLPVGLTAALKNNPSARYYTLAWGTLLIGNLAVLMAGSGMIPFNRFTSWGQFTGAAMELILLSLALGARMADISKQRESALEQQHLLQTELIQAEHEKTEVQEALLRQREAYIHDLDREVQNRTRDIRSILKAIHQGIFMISPGATSMHMRIQHEYSDHMHTLLHVETIEGQDPIELIFRSSSLSVDQLDQIKNALLNSLDSDLISFEMNSGHLPREMAYHRPGLPVTWLEIDWSPIQGEGHLLEKVLVTLRDVTDLRKLREQTQRQEEDLFITGELTTPQGRMFPKIRQNAERKMAQIEASLKGGNRTIQDLWPQALVFLHTLKGEARVCGFRTMATLVHEVESSLTDRHGVREASRLLEEFARVERLLKSYRLVYEVRLGRGDQTEERVFLSHRIAQKILDHLDGMSPLNLPFSQEELKLFKKQMNSALSSDLPTILDDQINDLRNLSQELNKSVPLVEFSGANVGIPRNLHDPLSQIFGHLFHNSMDHGIETKEERFRKGKSPAGTIRVRIDTIGSSSLRVQYRDDGRGLNISAIAKKAREGNWLPQNTVDPQTIANCIFVSGFSTRDQATMISGRGIGMDAVRSILEDVGGIIEIVLGPEMEAENFEFQLVMHIPLKPMLLAGAV